MSVQEREENNINDANPGRVESALPTTLVDILVSSHRDNGCAVLTLPSRFWEPALQ